MPSRQPINSDANQPPTYRLEPCTTPLKSLPLSRRFSTGCCCLVLCLPSTLSAEINPYIGLDIGAAYWDYAFIDDDVGLSFAGSLGLEWRQTLALELGYQNFGTMNFVSPSTEGEIEAESFSASAIVQLPVSDSINIYLQGGMEHLQYTQQPANPLAFEVESRDKGYYGLGLTLPRENNSAVRIGVTSHDNGDIVRLTIGGTLGLKR